MDAGSGRDRARIGVCVASALVVSLVPLPWLWFALRNASFAGLSREQGIYEGTAWAIAHGARLYRDLRESSGPLVHELYLLARLLGGADPHRLRSLDLGVSTLLFAWLGGSLPGATGLRPERRALRERAAWAAAGAVVLLAQYLSFYDASELTVPESLLDWFVLAAFACVLRALASTRPAAARRWSALAGAASVTAWLGEPLSLAYSALHLLALGAGACAAELGPRRRLAAFGAGALLGLALQAVFVAACCGAGELLQVVLLDTGYYRVLAAHGQQAAEALRHSLEPVLLAVTLALCACALIALRRLGRHMLAFALFPPFALALDLTPGRRLGAHIHSLSSGLALLVLALCCHVCGEAPARSDGSERAAAPVPVLWPLLLAALLGYRAAQALLGSPYLHADFAVLDGRRPEARTAPVYLRHYDTADFASVGLVEAGAFVRRHTRPKDRIQIYGMDPYLLALAERRSATPYLYATELNPNAIAAGVRASGGSPQAAAEGAARAQRNAADFVHRLQHASPAALVLIDRAPIFHPVHALDELLTCMPQLRTLLRRRYRERFSTGLVHVYLRNDRWPRRH